MMNRWRMLIWEQYRLIVPAFMVLFTLHVLVLFGGYFLFLKGSMWWWNYETLTTGTLSFVLLVFMYVLLVRRDHAGRITPAFNARYFLLPVKTNEVVAFFLGIRVIFLLLFCAATLMTGRIISAEMFTFRIISIVFALYCWLQVYAWGWKTLKPLLITLVVIVLFVFMYLFLLNVFWWSYDEIGAFVTYLVHASPLSLTLCFVAIHRQRAEDMSSLPMFDFLAGWSGFRTRSSLPPFKSRLEAQFWYETRNTWKMLFMTSVLSIPLLFFFLLFLLPLQYAFSLGMNLDSFITLTYPPAVIEVMAAFIIGSLILERTYCSFPFRHPLSHGVMAIAKVLAMIRSISLLTIGATVTIPLFMVDEFTTILIPAYKAGVIDIAYIVGLAARPALFFGCVAWLVLWWRARAVLVINISLLVLLIVLSMLNEFISIPSLSIMAIPAAFVLSMCMVTIWRLKRNGIYSDLQMRRLGACWLLVSATGFFFNFLITRHFGEALLLLSFISLLFLPVFALPFELKHRRSQ